MEIVTLIIQFLAVLSGFLIVMLSILPALKINNIKKQDVTAKEIYEFQ